jgi:HK97 gp10 family phage protein
MNIEITLKGFDQYNDRIKKAPDRASEAALIAMKTFTQACVKTIKDILNVRGEPDSTPRKRTGTLFMNVYGKTDRPSKFIIEGVVGDTAKYAGFLEYGTSKMKPRPFIRPTVERNTAYFDKLFSAIAEKI